MFVAFLFMCPSQVLETAFYKTSSCVRLLPWRAINKINRHRSLLSCNHRWTAKIFGANPKAWILFQLFELRRERIVILYRFYFFSLPLAQVCHWRTKRLNDPMFEAPRVFCVLAAWFRLCLQSDLGDFVSPECAKNEYSFLVRFSVFARRNIRD